MFPHSHLHPPKRIWAKTREEPDGDDSGICHQGAEGEGERELARRRSANEREKTK
jgi:hypothetical protein